IIKTPLSRRSIFNFIPNRIFYTYLVDTPIYEEGIAKLYQNIDYTKFREDIDTDKAMDILTWTMFGFGDKGLQELKTFANLEEFGEYYLREWNQYAEILKQSFYK